MIGTERCLPPLPMMVMRVGRDRRLLAFERQRLGNAKPRAVKQRQHGHIAGEKPWRLRFARVRLLVEHGARGGGGQRLGQSARLFGAAQTREGADGAVVISLQKAREGAQTRKLAQQRTVLRARHPPRGEKGAQIGGRELGDQREIWRFAEMIAEEIEKLRKVAPIGGKGVGRGAPLARKMIEPALRRAGERRRRGEFRGLVLGRWRAGKSHSAAMRRRGEGRVAASFPRRRPGAQSASGFGAEAMTSSVAFAKSSSIWRRIS